MAMYDFDLFSNDDVPKDREEREDCRERCFAVNDKKGNMVHFEAIREVPYSCPSFIRVCYYYDLVSSIDKLRGQLIDVAFDSSRLWVEEIADHSNIVGHDGRRRLGVIAKLHSMLGLCWLAHDFT